MSTPERDMQSIRLVGSLLLGIGLIQLILTLLVALFGLFAGISTNLGAFTRGIIAVALSALMASITSSCAIQMQQFKTYTQSNIQNIRLVWTALILVLIVIAIASAFLAAPLTSLAILMLLALFTIRPAIIRLSSP
jgi:hypothetical protein